LPLLTLLAPALAIRLGMRTDICFLMLSLGIHEAAHLFTALLLGIHISEIRILPFGGSMRIENPYHISSWKLSLIALAGPFANFMMVLLVSSAAHWNILSFNTARAFLAPNIILCLFNLLPALPLDGGRCMVALLSQIINEEKALLVGIYCGRCLAFLLTTAMVAGGFIKGVWNISFLFTAVFILASERDEKSALAASRFRRVREALDGFDMKPARLYQIDASRSAAQALNLIRPNENAWFIITKSGCPHSLLDSRSILQHIMDGFSQDSALETLPAYNLNSAKISSR